MTYGWRHPLHRASGGNQRAILLELKMVLRIKNGVLFKRVEKLVGKLRHGAIGILYGKALFSSIKQLMAMEPKKLSWTRCLAVREALNDWRQLIGEASKEVTHVKKTCAGGPRIQGST